MVFMPCASYLPPLGDSDPGYPPFIQVNDFLFRAGLVTSSEFRN